MSSVLGVSLLSQSPLAAGTSPAPAVSGFTLSPGLENVRPRIFTSADDLAAATRRYQSDPVFFKRLLPSPQSPEMVAAPIPLDQGITAQGTVFGLCRVAVAYRITRDERYLARLLEWLPVLENFQPIITARISGNEGLTAGHVLFGLSLVYDTLHGASDPRFEKAVRSVLIDQAVQTHRDLAAVKHYSYEQNHLSIPVCGLAIASLALVDEVPAARDWGVFSTRLADLCLGAIAHDGWFFEGISYWGYTMQFPSAYALALKRSTGRDLFGAPPFKDAPLYLAHMFLPDPDFTFDFGDWGQRVNADGTAQKGYELPWHTLPTRMKLFSPRILWRQTREPLLGEFLRRASAVAGAPLPIDAAFSMLWMEELPAPALPSQPPYHYFPDMEVMHWRSSWTDPDATALAFKSGPPAGHHLGTLLPQYPEWKPALGHAHPDAGSFLLFAKGSWLAIDTGYTGKKETADHNSLLVDGIGQEKGGTAWATFEAKPYSAYDKIHLSDTWLTPRVAASTAVFADAYRDDLELTQVNRHLILIYGRYLVIVDDLKSTKPHTYEFRLHGDRDPSAVSDTRILFENGRARFVLESLTPFASRKTGPTIVETELYSKTRSRPQQRGFHVALTSPETRDFKFITAACIQSGDEKPDTFTAKLTDPGEVRLTDGSTTCIIWTQGAPGLDGAFAYLLLDAAGSPIATGLKGKSLRTDALELTLETSGDIEFTKTPDGIWQTDSAKNPSVFSIK